MSGLVCELCVEEDREFTVPSDEIGAAVMYQHLLSEHGVVALVMRTCGECGGPVACKLNQPAPTSCEEHSSSPRVETS